MCRGERIAQTDMSAGRQRKRERAESKFVSEPRQLFHSSQQLVSELGQVTIDATKREREGALGAVAALAGLKPC